MNATWTATQGCVDDLRQPAGEIRNKLKGPKIEIQDPGVGHHDGTASAAHRRSVPSRMRAGTRRCLQALAGLGTMALLGYCGYGWWTHARAWVKTDNAYVVARIHQISSRVAGTVQEVLVDDNQTVESGAVVARLDRRDFELRREQAQAQVAQAHAQWQQAQAQIAQAVAHVAQQQARETRAQQDCRRAEALYHGSAGAISKQELDAAQAEHDAARAALRAAESALASARATASAAEAQEQVACTSLQDAELQLSYTELRAPADGRIGRKNIETGNRVQTGQHLLALVQPDVWVVANFKETQLTAMHAGQPARLWIDAFPSRAFTGRVDSVAPASGAQFALLPPDNATGNFTKIVQRIPVKIVLDPQSLGDCAGRVAAGMSAIVEVKVR